MFKKVLTLVLILAVLTACNAKKGLKQFKFAKPQQLYGGHINGQSLLLDYSKYIQPTATEVELIIFIIVGDDSSGKQFGWIQTSNDKDFHYSAVWGNHQSSYFSWYSDSFTIKTTPDFKVKVDVGIKIGGLNNGFNVYFSGYWTGQEVEQNEVKIIENKSQLTKQPNRMD